MYKDKDVLSGRLNISLKDIVGNVKQGSGAVKFEQEQISGQNAKPAIIAEWNARDFDVNEELPILDVSAAPIKDKNSLTRFIQGLIDQNKQEKTADGFALNFINKIRRKGKNAQKTATHISHSSQKNKHMQARDQAAGNILDLIKNSVFIEAAPAKADKKDYVNMYRFYTAVKTRAGIFPIRITALNKGPGFEFTADIYDVIIEKPLARLSVSANANTKPRPTTSKIKIADLLENVKAANNDDYIYKQIAVDINGTQRPALNSEGRPIYRTKKGLENFYKWFGDSKAADNDGKPLVFKDDENIFIPDTFNNEINRYSYKMSHRAPAFETDDIDTRLEDGGDFNLEEAALGKHNQPQDYFGKDGARIYGYDDTAGRQSLAAVNKIREALEAGKKNPTITIFRAVPANVNNNKIQNGDWVSLSKQYVIDHGEAALGGDYRILEQEVPAKNVWWDGNDIREWGYDDGTGAEKDLFVSIQNPAYTEKLPTSAEQAFDLKEQGFDGVISKDGKYLVFDKRQIKSVYNKGSFDKNDPNIYLQDNISDEQAAKDFNTFYVEAADIGEESQTERGLYDKKENPYTKTENVYENLVDKHQRQGLIEPRPEKWAGKTKEEVKAFLGFGDKKSIKIPSPIEDITLNEGHLVHLIDENDPNRKTHLLRTLSTIKKPNLIVRNGNKHFYIKIFSAENNEIKPHLQIVKVVKDGNFYVTNFAPKKNQIKRIIKEGQIVYDLSDLRDKTTTDGTIPIHENSTKALSATNNINNNDDIVKIKGLAQGGQKRPENGPKKTHAAPRGSIELSKNGGVYSALVKVMATGDKSTLLHELGHLYLYTAQDIYNYKEFAEMRKDLDAWLGKPREIDGQFVYTKKQQEKFARGLEAYLREGKAPTPVLQRIFDKFKEWFTAIYREPPEILSDAGREVYRRIFAIDAKDSKDALTFFQDEVKVKKTKQAVKQLRETGLPPKDAALEDIKNYLAVLDAKGPVKPKNHLLAWLKKKGVNYNSCAKVDKEAFKNAKIPDRKDGLSDELFKELSAEGFIAGDVYDYNDLADLDAQAADLIERALDGEEIYRLEDLERAEQYEAHKEAVDGAMEALGGKINEYKRVLKIIERLRKKGHRPVSKGDIKFLVKQVESLEEAAAEEERRAADKKLAKAQDENKNLKDRLEMQTAETARARRDAAAAKEQAQKLKETALRPEDITEIHHKQTGEAIALIFNDNLKPLKNIELKKGVFPYEKDNGKNTKTLLCNAVLGQNNEITLKNDGSDFILNKTSVGKMFSTAHRTATALLKRGLISEKQKDERIKAAKDFISQIGGIFPQAQLVVSHKDAKHNTEKTIKRYAAKATYDGKEFYLMLVVKNNSTLQDFIIYDLQAEEKSRGGRISDDVSDGQYPTANNSIEDIKNFVKRRIAEYNKYFNNEYGKKTDADDDEKRLKSPAEQNKELSLEKHAEQVKRAVIAEFEKREIAGKDALLEKVKDAKGPRKILNACEVLLEQNITSKISLLSRCKIRNTYYLRR